MLMPEKVKYRKQQRLRTARKAWRGSDVSFGDYGLKAMEPCRMTYSAGHRSRRPRPSDTLHQRGGKIWVRVFPEGPSEEWVWCRSAVRDGNHGGSASAIQPARGQAAHQDEVRHAVRRGESVMKIAEVRELTGRRAKELDDELFRLRIQKSMGQLGAPAKVRGVRRARCGSTTILREKQK